MSVAHSPAYVSTLGSAIESQDLLRNELNTLTEQFLNQGGKITELSTKFHATKEAAPSAHNQRKARETRKWRDSFITDIVEALSAGTIPSKIYKDLNISSSTFNRIIEENDLHSFLNQGK